MPEHTPETVVVPAGEELPAPRRAADLRPPQRSVGRSGLRVSAVGLGCNNLGRTGTVTATPEGAQELLDAALDAGITFFDVADNYGARPGLAEQILGETLGSRRADVVIGTKFGMPVGDLNGPDVGARGSRRYVRRAVEGSLRRLGTDWIDLYQFHTPDPSTPVEETLDALDELVREGKVLYVGHANRAGWQIADAEHVARERGTQRFVSAQNEYNLLARKAELEVIPAAQAYDLGVFPFFPLANGLLTGKYAHGARPQDGRLVHSKPELLESAPWEALARLHAFAQARGLTDAEVAIGWLLARPQVASVIAGATTPTQVRANAASARWEATAGDLAELDAIFPPPTKVAPF